MAGKRASKADVAVGKVLKERRVGAGVTLTAFADAIGLSFQQVQKYESGANRMSVTTFVRAADVLKVPASALMREVEARL